MGKLIALQERIPHISSECICLHCGYEWIGVFPTGVTSLECPECGLMKGVFKGVCVPEKVLECNCGCRHCFVSGEGNIICCNCGITHRF